MELFVSRKLGLREILFIIILFTASHLEKLRWHNPYICFRKNSRASSNWQNSNSNFPAYHDERKIRWWNFLAYKLSSRVTSRCTSCHTVWWWSSNFQRFIGTGGGTTSRQAFSSYIRSDTPYLPFSPLLSASFRSLPAAVSTGGGNVIAPRHEDQSTLMTLTVGRKRVGFTRLPSNRIVTLLWRIKANSVRVLVMMMMMVWYRVTIIPVSHLPPRYWTLCYIASVYAEIYDVSRL